MKSPLRLLFGALALIALPTLADAQTTSPKGFPVHLRWDLVPKWILWTDQKPTIRWPTDGGCAAPPVDETLQPGTRIDRFGLETGNFFSPQGESFASRAMPYVCQQMDYRVYKVLKPLSVKSCKAAAWFGEPGGAVQVQAVAADPARKLSAQELVAAGAIVAETHRAAGRGGPQCGPP